jgi:hypothetical protein
MSDTAARGNAKSTYSSVRHEQRVGEGARQFWKAVFSESSLAQNASDEQFRRWVCTSLGQLKSGRHERERLCIPNIAVVDRQHDDVTDTKTNRLVELEAQRKRCLERCNLNGNVRSLLIDREVTNGAMLTYCQSNEKEKRPRPSLFDAPPKILVRVSPVAPVACIDARHGMDTELSHGQMYAGRNS